MKKIIELVDLSFKNSHEYFEKSIDIQHIIKDFVSTLTPSQMAMFENLMSNVYKLHKLDIDIVKIHCKDMFVDDNGIWHVIMVCCVRAI